MPWEDVFESIEPEPLAAGTIGQVHAATLESGDRVVVKVQRHGAADEIMRDLGLLELFAEKAENRDGLRRARRLPGGHPPPLGLAQPRARLPPGGREHRPARRGAASPTRGSPCPHVYPRALDASACSCSTSSTASRPRRADVPERQRCRAAADRVVLPADPRRRLLPRRPASRATCSGRTARSTSSTAAWSASSTRELREQMLLLVTAFWQEDDEFLAEIVLSLLGEETAGRTSTSTSFEPRSRSSFGRARPVAAARSSSGRSCRRSRRSPRATTSACRPRSR